MSNSNLISFQVPKLKKDKLDNWCIYMRALLNAHDVWDIVENGYVAPDYPTTLTQDQKELLQSIKKKDQKVISLFHQALDEATFEKVSNASTAKQAWNTL